MPLAARNVKLIITVDVGTTAVKAVAHAKEKGIDVIVTDHHEIVSELPEAVAILNPEARSVSVRGTLRSRGRVQVRAGDPSRG